MFKKSLLQLMLILSFVPNLASANWLKDIFEMAVKIYGVNLDMNNVNQAQLDEMAKLTASLNGTHDFGAQYYDANRFSWGQGSNDWQSILAMTSRGGSSGQLGMIISQLARQYPIKPSLGSTNPVENQYYRMQAQTALASRASAQLAFAQMNQEAETMKYLHNQIDTTKDNKSAVDLTNRLAAENTMVNIQQTKLLAILAEQGALEAQEKANVAKESAEFFDIK